MAVLECPFCYKSLNVESPTKFHTAFSLERPIRNSFHGNVVRSKVRCQNPECRKTFTVFWYAPLEYFDRI